MKGENGLERRRNPLSDVTNSKPNPLPPSPSSSSKRATLGVDASEPISAFCNRIHILNEKKRNIKKAMANPKLYTIRDKTDGATEHQGLDLPKASLLTARCRKVNNSTTKKRRAVSNEQDVSKDAQLQDYIEKQNAYFKEIDKFELPEEEVESVNELD